MPKSLENIIVVTTTELTATSIDSYFRQIALIHEFEDDYLVTGQTFSANDYEEYENIDDVAVKFPSASTVYKWAADAFAQKTNSGVNGSTFEKLVIIRKDTTDLTYEDALTRVNYRNAYWNIPVTDVVAEVSSVYDWASTKYMLVLTQDDSANLLGTSTADIASVSQAANDTRIATFYHSEPTEGLAVSIAAILASANPGDKSAFYKTPTGITVDNLTAAEITILEGKNANFFSLLQGTAGTFNSGNYTFNGVLADGNKIQKKYQQDRIIVTLQTAGMNALAGDIPYDNRGGAILESALKTSLHAFYTQEIIKDQTFVNRNGSTVNGYYIEVERTEDTLVNSPSDYADQKFRVFIEYLQALTAEKVSINITYSV